MQLTPNALMRKTQLLTCEITDERILQAIAAVPREKFVPEHFHDAAYVDEDIPLGHDRYLPEPLVFSRLLTLAAVQPSDHVLDIGCGMGYGAAVISHLARHITAVEMHQDLAQVARKRLSAENIDNVDVIVAPLTHGCSQHQPYDVIVLEGAVRYIPEALLAQLRPGGKLVGVEVLETRPGSRSALGATLVMEKNENNWVARHGVHLSAALLPGFEHAQHFTFN